MATVPLRLPWGCVVRVQPCLGRSSGGGAGSGCELQRGWDPARASFPWPACGSERASSGWDELAPRARICPALCTSCRPSPSLLCLPLAPGLGRPGVGCTALPFLKGVLFSSSLSLFCPNPVQAAFLRGSSRCLSVQRGPQRTAVLWLGAGGGDVRRTLLLPAPRGRLGCGLTLSGKRCWLVLAKSRRLWGVLEPRPLLPQSIHPARSPQLLLLGFCPCSQQNSLAAVQPGSGQPAWLQPCCP